jgi:hypothetical protein
VEAKPKTIGTVYRDEAADLIAAAARGPGGNSRPHAHTLRTDPPLVQPERRRPLPYPEPIGVNDNPDDIIAERPRRRLSVPRLIARILIAPLYVALAAAAIAVIVLFARGLLGL